MRYQVPQFIEVEDKIFGPLTIKQFLYVGGGVAIGFILWNTLPKFIAVIIALPLVIFFIALAFYKYNDRPLIFTVEGAVKYFFSKKLYIWNKKPKEIKPNNKKEAPEVPKLDLPKLSNSKLKELSWGLDVNENIK
jgi:hypothetical protein